MGNFRKLKVWQQARSLTNSIYRSTEQFPRAEQFGLTAQMRSASVSIMSNIAEGCGRNGKGELIRFLNIARGSATELESHLVVAEDQGFLNQTSSTDLQQNAVGVQKMLAGLIRHLTDNS